MKQAIITGPTGAVGMALIKQLLNNKIEVVAVVRPNSLRAKRLEQFKDIMVVECALDDLHGLCERIKQKGFVVGDECVFYHLAWDGTFGNSRDNMHGQNLNVKYSLDAVDAANAIGCEAFVGTGSQAEYGRVDGKLNALTPTFPENGYGIAKLCAGQMTRIACKQLGLRHIWTRILSIYGPYDGMKTMVMSTIEKLLNGERPDCTLGEQMWDYLYADDAGNALRLIGEKGVDGKIYCIGSGEVKPLKSYIEMIRDSIDCNLSIGFGEIAYNPKQVMYLCADIEELTKDTGFKPSIGFEDGIKSTVEYVKNNILFATKVAKK